MGTGLDCSWINELNPILLKKGEWEAYVLPQYGMNAIALLNGKKRLLRTPDTKAEFLALPEGFGTPPLLPANRTADGIFRFEGKQYQLPINDRFHTHKHGFLHTSAFSVACCTAASVEGVYENSGSIYPFPFRMTIRCELYDEGLKQTYTLENIGISNMPVIFAIHAAFHEPESCWIPIESVWLADDRCLPTGQKAPLPAELIPYTDGSSRGNIPVGYCCPSSGNCVRLDDIIFEVSEQFTQWIVWNGDGNQGFLCVEPQTAPSNVLNRPGEAMVVAPGEKVSFWTYIHR